MWFPPSMPKGWEPIFKISDFIERKFLCFSINSLTLWCFFSPLLFLMAHVRPLEIIMCLKRQLNSFSFGPIWAKVLISLSYFTYRYSYLVHYWDSRVYFSTKLLCFLRILLFRSMINLLPIKKLALVVNENYSFSI